MDTSEACRIIKTELKKTDKNVSVRKGTGTIFEWVLIRTSIDRQEVRRIIEVLKKEKGLELSTFYGDMDDRPRDCVVIN